MDYSVQTKVGTITISGEIIFNTIKNIAKTLSIYEVTDIQFGKNVNGLITFFIYLKNNDSSVSYIDYISKFQKRLERGIAASLNISNFFSVIVLN